jgi:hypothetical protein
VNRTSDETVIIDIHGLILDGKSNFDHFTSRFPIFDISDMNFDHIGPPGLRAANGHLANDHVPVARARDGQASPAQQVLAGKLVEAPERLATPATRRGGGRAHSRRWLVVTRRGGRAPEYVGDGVVEAAAKFLGVGRVRLGRRGDRETGAFGARAGLGFAEPVVVVSVKGLVELDALGTGARLGLVVRPPGRRCRAEVGQGGGSGGGGDETRGPDDERSTRSYVSVGHAVAHAAAQFGQSPTRVVSTNDVINAILSRE